MIPQQSSQKHMHQKSHSNANIHQNLQTVGDVQSNRNSLNQNGVYSVRNNTSSNDSSCLISSSSNNHRFNPFKPVCNQPSQRSGGQAFDIQINSRNSISNQLPNNGIGVKRNSSQEIIPPYSTKNENFNMQNFKPQSQQKQHQVLGISNQNISNNHNNEYIENSNQLNHKNFDLSQGQPQKTSDQKKNSLIPHHGGSKSLDQQAFKRMGSCPNNLVQGIQFNQQLHQSTNQSSSSNQYSKGQQSIGQNYINGNLNYKQGQSYLTNRSNLNSNNLTNQTSNQSQNHGSQMNIQHYLNSNKHGQNPSIQNNNHTRTPSNILSEYQSAKQQPYDNKMIKQQQVDYVSNQPYLSNQFENKNLIISQELDESIEQRLYNEQQMQRHNLQLQNQQQIPKNEQYESNKQSRIKEKTSSNERQKQQVKHQNDYIQHNQNDLYFAKQNQQQQSQQQVQNQQSQQSTIGFNQVQNQIGSIDMSIINNSINQRDISMIKPINIDISCFSRDQSMFLDGNKDVSINMRDQSSFFYGYNKKPSNNQQNIITSGYDLPNLPEQPNYITAEKGEYPTLSNPNLNHSKSLILDGLKDMSINYSKVEEISNFLEQEKEKNAKLEEKVKNKDNILKKMQEFQNDLFQNYEQAQTVIKQLKSENAQESKLLLKIQSLQDENQILREQLIKAEEIHELKQKDVINQLNKLKQEKDEIEQLSQQKIEQMIVNMNQFKKHYEEKIMKLQQQIEKEKNLQKKNKVNSQEQQLNEFNGGGVVNYKQIVQQIQIEFDIQKEHEIIPKMKLLGDKDMIKLTECLTEMMISFAPNGYFEKKPTLKQIWKWLKEVLKEYMKNTSDLKKAIKYLNAESQSDFIGKLEKMVFENESYYKIIEQMKLYFNLDPHQFSNLYELQLFLEKKNILQSKQLTNQNSDLPSTQQEYIYTNLTTDSSKM